MSETRACNLCGFDSQLLWATHGCTNGACPHRKPSPLVPRAELDEALAALDRAREALPHVECPECGTSIRARMADVDDGAELRDLRAKVDAVRALHRRSPRGVFPDCTECAGWWPCPTVAALGEVAGRDEEGS